MKIGYWNWIYVLHVGIKEGKVVIKLKFNDCKGSHDYVIKDQNKDNKSF